MIRYVLLFAVAACHPYVAAGYDTTSHVRGTLANVMSQPVARQVAAAEAPAAPAQGKSYSFAVGFGARDFKIELGLHAHDVSRASFALPNVSATNSPRYVTSSGSLDCRWTWLRLGRLSTSVHFGPTEGLLVDRMSGQHAWGQGVRFGATAAIAVAGVSAFVDVYRTDILFSDGPAAGFSDLSGVTLGLALHD